jgi:hypothetical protein
MSLLKRFNLKSQIQNEIKSSYLGHLSEFKWCTFKPSKNHSLGCPNLLEASIFSC